MREKTSEKIYYYFDKYLIRIVEMVDYSQYIKAQNSTLIWLTFLDKIPGLALKINFLAEF